MTLDVYRGRKTTTQQQEQLFGRPPNSQRSIKPKTSNQPAKSVIRTLKFRAEHDKFARQLFAKTKKKKKLKRKNILRRYF